jgi:SAM-dependent methyltransferase
VPCPNDDLAGQQLDNKTAATFAGECRELYPKSIFDKADQLHSRGIFLGGPRTKFVTAGRGQLEVLLSRGLLPHHRVLDIGCGALRGGWWLINFLRADSYFGIEPNKKMLDAGIEVMLGRSLLNEKRPRFAKNADFDFSVFGEQFDFLIARSVWTHASREQICTMLDSFIRCSVPAAEFVTSICLPRTPFHRQYRGAKWVGRSHESDTPGVVHYRLSTIRKLCHARQLVAEKLGVQDGQTWVLVKRP